eukprot:TRINITY_DN1316_c0_g1_i3.p1 TRINITY_DN1316_c0_g1~~TRINITY_DN1316_c0_g1_i3.p1  ORF type:complete len:147 (+),score=8.05 TRINITY_DN1316_c0_g1_i3:64-441(+)
MEVAPMETKHAAMTWEDFKVQAQDLCAKNPTTTRYVVKFRNKENMAVVKVVSGSAVIKYKTARSEDAGKIEEFNRFFLAFASNRKPEKGWIWCKRVREREEEVRIELLHQNIHINPPLHLHIKRC